MASGVVMRGAAPATQAAVQYRCVARAAALARRAA
jgi:hypothetical protein